MYSELFLRFKLDKNDRLWLPALLVVALNNLLKMHKQKIHRAQKASELWNTMLLSVLDCGQSSEGLSALRIIKTLCWNVAYDSGNFTPNEDLETSSVQSKTQMAVQSLAWQNFK